MAEWAVWTLSVVGGIGLVSAFAAGLSLGGGLIFPRASNRKRALASSAIAALLPMSIPLMGFLFEAEISDGSDFALSLTALVLLTALVWAVFALPPAWWVAGRTGREKGTAPALPHDEPDLIPSEG